MKKRFKAIILLTLAIIIVSASPSHSAVKYRCYCQYQRKRDNSFSDSYKLNVIFATGEELNNATNSYRYKFYKPYAIIYFKGDEYATVELNNLYLGSNVVKQSDILFYFIYHGYDKRDYYWEIKPIEDLGL